MNTLRRRLNVLGWVGFGVLVVWVLYVIAAFVHYTDETKEVCGQLHIGEKRVKLTETLKAQGFRVYDNLFYRPETYGRAVCITRFDGDTLVSREYSFAD